MKQYTNVKNIIEPLTWLVGEWKGKGSGGFPTHNSFEYSDYMHFKIEKDGFDNEPLIHFEEIAKTLENGEYTFKHWETGYFKPTHDGRVEFYVCHNTGRIEITYGIFHELNMAERSFKIRFESENIRNDEGTKMAIKSVRELRFLNGILFYKLGMSTSEVESVTNHLEAKLERNEVLNASKIKPHD